jgi:hypothetical protein
MVFSPNVFLPLIIPRPAPATPETVLQAAEIGIGPPYSFLPKQRKRLNDPQNTTLG